MFGSVPLRDLPCCFCYFKNKITRVGNKEKKCVLITW
jgi:hypothetical protein